MLLTKRPMPPARPKRPLKSALHRLADTTGKLGCRVHMIDSTSSFLLWQ